MYHVITSIKNHKRIQKVIKKQIYPIAIVCIIAMMMMTLAVSCAEDAKPVNAGTGGGNSGKTADDPAFLGNPPVLLSEVYIGNTDFLDEFGGNPGWVELYNPSNAAVNLSGYFLTNSAGRKTWEFGNVVVPARGYVIVFMSGRNRPDFLPARDSIDLIGSAVGAWGWADSQREPPDRPGRSTSDVSFVRNASFSGTLVVKDNSGIPGLDWSSAEAVLKLKDWGDSNYIDMSKTNQVLFSGFLSKDSKLDVRLGHEGVNDWEAWGAVLTGTGVAGDLYAIDMPPGGGGFPDLKIINKVRCANPSSFRGTIEFSFNSIVARNKGNFPHASFELSGGGGRLFLLDADGNIRDSVAYPAEVRGLSYARNLESGGWALSKPPTPVGANAGETYDGQVQPPASVNIPASGYYAEALSFTLPSGEGGSVMHCDTTGRLPTAESALKSGVAVSIAKTAVMRCAWFKPGSYASEPVMRTYFVGESRLPSLPVVSIAVDPYDMFDSDEGLYSTGNNASSSMPYYGANFWRDTELPVQIDFFEGGMKHAWNHPAGLRIFGNYSRMHAKKSVVLSFRGEYGLKSLRYPMFPEFPHLAKFNHIIVRNGGNSFGLDYIRDMLMTSLTGGFLMDDPKGLGIEYQKGRAAIVFYNGQYFGIHNMRERSNGDYFDTNFGIDEDFIDLVKGSNEVSRGSDADYKDIVRWLEGVSLADDANLAKLAQRIDIDNYTNYLQSEIYYQNCDWPGNNLKRWRSNSPPSKWRWFLFDTDYGFDYPYNQNRNVSMLSFVTAANGPDWPNPPHSTFLTRKLLENQNYRNAFVNRFSLLIATYFDPGRVSARIDALMAPIESEIPLDRSRWGHSAATYNTQLNTIRSFGNNRPARMQNEIGQFFSLSNPVDFTVSIEGPGEIFVHDLRVPNGGATFKAYTSVPVALRAVPSPGVGFIGWSDGVTARERTVAVGSGAAPLVAIFGGTSVASRGTRDAY
jgi:hypothetical protein